MRQKKQNNKNSDLDKEKMLMWAVKIWLVRHMPEQIFITVSSRREGRGEAAGFLHPVAPGAGWTDYDAAITIQNAKLWSPEHPFLYDLEIRAGEDHVKSYFAMRTFLSRAG